MIAKPVNGKCEWLFPSCFQYIRDHQRENGGWEGGDLTDVILNTLASLLSLIQHEKNDGENGLAYSIVKAITFLGERFFEWNVAEADRVGTEIIVPSMLQLLEKEGVKFNFPKLDMLLQLKETKMSKFNLDILYKYPTTMLFSLEAFIGFIEFDKVKHHLSGGSMVCSPSATAAYLMNVSEWDERAENYLIDAVNNGPINEEGMVANVYPISTFEFGWVALLSLVSLIIGDVQYTRKWT